MPESIISFPIDDGPFKAFLDLYNKFKESIEKLPAEWEKVNEGIEKGAVGLDHLLAALLGQNDALDKTLKIQENLLKIEQERDNRSEAQRKAAEAQAAEKELERQAAAQAKYWNDMAGSAGRFALNIKDATLSLLKWASITGLIGGLLGGGGLFGIARLSDSASGGRQNSLGLGIPYGQLQAFGVSYARLLGGQGGAESFLHNVQSQQLSIGGLTQFAGLGITQDMMKGKNTAEVGETTLDHLRDLAIKYKGNPAFKELWNANRGGAFMSAEDAQVLSNTGDKEYGELKGRMRENTKRFANSDADLKKWQDLSTALDTAKQTIESVLIKGLSNLAPDIESLSKSVADLIGALIGGESGKKTIQLLQEGLHWLAETVGDPGFQDNVRSFVENIGKLAIAVGQAVVWLVGDRPHTPEDYGPGGNVPNAGNPSEEDINKGADYWEKLFDRLFKGVGPLGIPDGGISPTSYTGGGMQAVPVGFRYNSGSNQPAWMQHGDNDNGGQGGQPAWMRGGNDNGGGGDYSGGEGNGTAPLGLIRRYESNNQNVRNYRYDPGHTAQGYYQITNQAWREIAPKVGAGAYDNAMAAPDDVQTRVAEELFRERGIQPWSTNQALMRHYRNGEGGQFPRPGGNRGGSSGRVQIDVNNNTGGSATISARQYSGGNT